MNDSKFYIPTKSPECWKSLLADPNKHWKENYSAQSLAYCWQQANDFPNSIKKAFIGSNIDFLQDLELIFGMPEYKVHLPGGSTASQNDIFILAKSKLNNELICIMVEGKVSEPFGPTIFEWKQNISTGKEKRLKYLLEWLNMQNQEVDNIRYQLLHRTVSALITAKKLNAKYAVMLIHSFSKSKEWIDDYFNFLELLNAKKIEKIQFLIKTENINLLSGWISEES